MLAYLKNNDDIYKGVGMAVILVVSYFCRKLLNVSDMRDFFSVNSLPLFSVNR